ncbi:MAG: hypothetical protein ACP5IA_07425, partial [Sediminispirochaetaceae bacterium]
IEAVNDELQKLIHLGFELVFGHWTAPCFVCNFMDIVRAYPSGSPGVNTLFCENIQKKHTGGKPFTASCIIGTGGV